MNPRPFLTTLMIFFCLGSESMEASSKPVGNTLRKGEQFSYNDSMESARGNFKLGFFSKLNSTRYYLGIWFKNASHDKPVWVANRESPFSSSSVCLTFDSNGNLALNDGKMWYYVTSTSLSPTYAMLLDSGNLVLLYVSNSAVVWQSFNDPTDTILPGMTLENPLTLRSWKNTEDPAPGDFSINVQDLSRLVIMRRTEVYRVYTNYNFSFNYTYNRPDASFSHSVAVSRENKFTWQAVNRIVLEVSGEVNQQYWSNEKKQWLSVQSSICGANDLCGKFGMCNPQSRMPCNCLQGFEPYDEYSWGLGNTSSGCVRRTPLSCSDPNKLGREDQFLLVIKVDLPQNESLVPNITSAVDCQNLCSRKCSCLAYTYVSNGCLHWSDQLLDLKNVSVDVADSTDQNSFFLKLAAPEFDKDTNQTSTSTTEKKSHRRMLTTILLITLVALSTLTLSRWCYLRNKKSRKGEDLLLFDLGRTKMVDSTEQPQGEMLGAVRKREIKFPLFSFASVAAATGNFSPNNKLGEGGFGPVFKGKLLNGDEVAVKRLSKKSGQGWEELENEALLIAKVQHRNLVRLFGCCVEKDEKILIYELMPNKSLDFFLFGSLSGYVFTYIDPTKRTELDWETRVGIIDGIAQGLLYLHEYSRPRIIHRDLKAGNILLDVSMTPKISDFGMARIFGGNELGANTRRIVGTFGYMAPEYALEGHFSVKSDVFSFGVLLLEILTGKKNSQFFQTKSLNLLNHAWEFWKSNKVMEIIDSTLTVSSEAHRVHRYVIIGFLCVQQSPTDRPTMSEIVSMLINETTTLPCPKQPAFTSSSGKESSSQGSVPRSVSHNQLSKSVLQPR